MKITPANSSRPDYLPFNRYAYVFMLLTGGAFIYMKDWGQAATWINLSLAFDPFNPAQPWALRPFWQRVWLILHLVFGIGVLILNFNTK
ncbi:hypothetical protein ACFQ3S_00695 [Mucilaginibacter terrae]|uniref:hypothetical protein n=1 Tax=Mucilaginibacter terrae TaxID=1955052 RepID=UPI003634AB3C